MTGPRRLSALRRSLVLVLGLAAVLGMSTPAHAAPIWSKNLYVSSAFLYQDPYGQACVAASAMIMLNTIAYRQTGGAGFSWTPYRVKSNTSNPRDVRDMTSIQWFARAHDTLSPSGSGSDAHGWRNALNYHGWGMTAMTDPASRVYDDLQYSSYSSAVRAAVKAIARFGKPVGIVGWAGRHAQVMTGYIVEGENPATSDAFVVRYIYLSDPLRSNAMVNVRISNWAFQSGNLKARFQAYRETDSPYDDVYTNGWRRSSVAPTTGISEWYRRWVILAPIRDGRPDGTPPPEPTPTPTPTPPPPDPTPTPTPAPSAAPSGEPDGEPTATPSPEPSPEPSPSAP